MVNGRISSAALPCHLGLRARAAEYWNQSHLTKTRHSPLRAMGLHILRAGLAHIVVEAGAMGVHRHQQRPEALDPELFNLLITLFRFFIAIV